MWPVRSWSWAARCLILCLVLAAALYLYMSGREEEVHGRKSPVYPEVVIYNRIPKTGSTTLMQLPYRLHKENKLNVLLVNVTGGPTSYTMTLKDRLAFERNVTGWTSKHPALFHGHFAYFDVGSAVHINVIRRPVERLVSYYYFLRYGDDFRANKIRSRMGDKVTFDECVAARQPDCDARKLWLQVPWFCGHFKACWSSPGSRWALEQAKFNLANKYLLVGVTDELEAFIDVLEWALPRFFRGAGALYRREGERNRNRVRKTKHKEPPSEGTLRTLKSSGVWKAENEFYEFALGHFKGIVAEFREAKASGNPDRLHFHYDKVRPAGG